MNKPSKWFFFIKKIPSATTFSSTMPGASGSKWRSTMRAGRFPAALRVLITRSRVSRFLNKKKRRRGRGGEGERERGGEEEEEEEKKRRRRRRRNERFLALQIKKDKRRESEGKPWLVREIKGHSLQASSRWCQQQRETALDACLAEIWSRGGWAESVKRWGTKKKK